MVDFQNSHKLVSLWQMVFAGICFFALLLFVADFAYRKTYGHQILETRVIAIAYDNIITDSGVLSLRYSTRSFYGRKDIKAQIRIGCRYRVAVSDGLIEKLGFHFSGRSKLPYLESVIQGLEEPKLGCSNLYKGG